MDNPVRAFADCVKRQFNALRDFQEIDDAYMVEPIEDLKKRTIGIGRRKGRGLTSQDVNRHRNRELAWKHIDPDFPLQSNFEFPPGRTETRLSTALRIFNLTREVMTYRREALVWVHANPEYMPVGAAITWMNSCHRFWLRKLEEDSYNTREEEEEWHEMHGELLNWIEEIEEAIAFEQKDTPITTKSFTSLQQRLLAEIKASRFKEIQWQRLYSAWPKKSPSEDTFIKAMARLKEVLDKSKWDLEVSAARELVIVHKKPKT